MEFFKQNKRIWAAACCALVGILFFFLLFDARILNPLETRWVRFGGGDNFQHYIGWRFYRGAPWIRYLTFYRNLNYPIGTTTVVTDSNPLFALFFKIFNSVLPDAFQYNGIWLLLSFGLCGFFAGCIGYRITNSFCLSLIFTAMVLGNPVPVQRAVIHDTLAGHWLILAAIYLLLTRASRRNAIGWGVLIFVAIGIHLYFLPMLLAVLFIQFLSMIRERADRVKFIILISAALSAAAAGYFVFGYGLILPESAGFGELSMNLNAFFNPDGASLFIPARPTFPLQYEGFNYWGLGMILSLAAALIMARRDDYRKIVPAVFPALMLILFALSNRIAFDRRLLIEFELPDAVLSFASIFRSSGRMAWPIYYLASVWIFSVFFRVYSESKRKPVLSRFFMIALVAAAAVQYGDLLPFYRSIFERVRTVVSADVEPRLDRAVWNELRQNIDHLEISDGESALKDEFALLAADLGWTINKNANARGVRAVLGGDSVSVEERLRSGLFQERTLYVFLADDLRALALGLYPDMYAELDGFGVLIF